MPLPEATGLPTRFDADLPAPTLAHYVEREETPEQVVEPAVANITPHVTEVLPQTAPSQNMQPVDQTAIRVAELQLEHARENRRTARAVTRGNVAHAAKWPVAVAATAVAAVVLYNQFFGGSGKNAGSPPSSKLPTPEAAISMLSAPQDFAIAAGHVNGEENATFRFTACIPILDILCQDTHLGHDVATRVDSDTEYDVPASSISYGVARDAQNKAHLLIKLSSDEVTYGFKDPQYTHPVADNQSLADLAAAAKLDSGLNGAIDLAQASASSDLKNRCAETVMEAGKDRGDALAGAVAEAGRADVKRLDGLLLGEDKDAAKVVSELVAGNNQIWVNVGAGLQIVPAKSIPAIHVASWGAHIDFTFGQPKECTLSGEASQKLGNWTDPTLTKVVHDTAHR